MPHPQRCGTVTAVRTVVVAAAVAVAAFTFGWSGTVDRQPAQAGPVPLCVIRAVWDPVLGSAPAEALDQFTGYTGIRWEVAVPATATLTIVVVDGNPDWAGRATGVAADGHVISSARIEVRRDQVGERHLVRLLVHELAHTIGVDHNVDEASLLSPHLDRYDVLLAGDVAVLAAAGQRCRPLPG